MPAITTTDSEIDMDKSSSDSDVDETLTKPAAEECSESYDNEQINEVPQQQPESRPK